MALDMSKYRAPKGQPQAVVTPPTPPPIDETLIENMMRRGGNQARKILGPLGEATEATLRSSFNTGTFGTTNWLEGQLSGDPEKTNREAIIARERFPKASAAGDAAAAIAQTVPAVKALGWAAPVLRQATPFMQAIRQGIAGGTQAAGQNVYESFRDDRPIEPGSLLRATALGTGLNALGGGLASKISGAKTAAGHVSQILPEGLSAAERTAIANQLQRAASHGADVDLPTAMRLANTPGAPTVERTLQRGSRASGTPVGEVPDRLASNLDQAQSSLTRSEADTAQQTAGRTAQAQRDLARLQAIADAERATVTEMRRKTSPRIEEIRKQIVQEGKLGVNPSPSKARSPEIYEEISKRLTDLGETQEVNTLLQALERAMPTRVPLREAREQLDNLTMNGLPPSPATQAARGQLDELREIEGAIVNRPAAPDVPRGGRPREVSAGLGGWGGGWGPHFRYRGKGGPDAPGPTVERAAQMLREEPERAAGILGQVRPWEAPAGVIPAEASRTLLEPIAEGFFGPPRKRKRASD